MVRGIIPIVATNRFRFRSKVNNAFLRIQAKRGKVVKTRWYPMYASHEHSVKWSIVIEYTADDIIK